MSKIIVGLFIVFAYFVLFASPSNAEAATKVKGYVKKSGTYVQPYYKSTPNKTKFDNYSTKGNINPFTGKKGTVSPIKPTIKTTPKFTIKKFR